MSRSNILTAFFYSGICLYLGLSGNDAEIVLVFCNFHRKKLLYDGHEARVPRTQQEDDLHLAHQQGEVRSRVII